MTHTLFGQPVSLDDLAHLSNLTTATVKRRLSKGATTEDLIRTRTTNHVRIGNKYGDFTVESRAANDFNHWRKWNCKCTACGKRRRIHESDLKESIRVQCPCTRKASKAKTSRLKWVDYDGQPIGKRGGIVLGYTGKVVKVGRMRDHVWLCRCACGKRFEMTASAFRSGREWCGEGCPKRKRVVGDVFRARAPKVQVGDKMLTWGEAAAIAGVTPNCLRLRVKRLGITIEEAMRIERYASARP